MLLLAQLGHSLELGTMGFVCCLPCSPKRVSKYPCISQNLCSLNSDLMAGELSASKEGHSLWEWRSSFKELN